MNRYKNHIRLWVFLIASIMSCVAIAQDENYGIGDGFDPGNPGNPGSNGWNAATGEVIIDDFTTGNLNNSITKLIGNSGNDAVTKIVVAGVINDTDFRIGNNYAKCTSVDFSRTAGISIVPSSAYSDNTHLCSIMLPTSITDIGSNAFKGCSALTAMTCYTLTPPKVGSNALNGVADNMIVYVPSEAVDRYQEADVWKNYTILPIQETVHSLTVNMPSDIDLGAFKNMTLELVNAKSGQSYRYIITDKASYVFNNLIENTVYKAYVKNNLNNIFGETNEVSVNDKDAEVTFASLSIPQNVNLSIIAGGNDITSQATVTWTDSTGNYLSQGSSLTGYAIGKKLNYSIALPQNIVMEYALPNTTQYVVADGENNIVCTLTPLQKVVITGKVLDLSTKSAISGAVVSASQTFGGKYSKTTNAKTDSKGQYSIEIFRVPTSLAIAASDYISQTMECDVINAEEENISVDDVSLKSISGAVISIDFTYKKCPDNAGEEGEVESFYTEYNNVDYTIFNKTQNRSIGQFNVQYPQIVLLEEVNENDVLEIMASSRTSAFVPVKATATIDAEQHASATFDIVELGKLKSSFTANTNTSVVGSLYDTKGKLIKTYDYSGNSLTISDLADGNYTLVTMGSSRLFNTIYDLNQLPQTGLTKDVDYVQNSVSIKSGELSIISIAEVPTLDESKLYYTGDNTSFTVNKSSIVAGNYLTLTGHLDFKSAYSSRVSNVNLIVDLSESCTFVENSVMVGNSTSSYTLEGNRVIIPMARYTDRVRFCIIPTLGGEYAPSALAQFDIDGETITQPIGSATYTAKDLSITVPSTVSKTTIPVSGTAIGASDIEIYDGDVLIGQTISLANGTWATTCELNEPYNLSTHSIYAKVTTKQGLGLQSETVECMYDINAIEARTVTMSFYNGWLKRNIEVTFDLENKTIDASSYMFYTTTDITFVADLTNNDTTVVNGVTIRVYTDKNNWRELKASYDKKIDKWVASSKFSSNELPVGVKVRVYVNIQPLGDRTELDVKLNSIDNYNEKYVVYEDSIKELEQEILSDSIASVIKEDKLNEIMDGIENTVDDKEAEVLMNEFFNALGLSTSSDDYVITIPENPTHDYVENLLAKGDSLLNDTLLINANTYNEAIVKLLGQIDAYLQQPDSIRYDEAFSNVGDSLVYEDHGIRKLFYIADYNSFDFNLVDTTMCEHITMTTGADVLAYSDGNEMIIIDKQGNKVVVVEVYGSVRSLRRGAMRRVSVGDVIEKIQTAIQWIKNTIDGVLVWKDKALSPIEKEIEHIGKNIETLSDLQLDIAQRSSAMHIKATDLEKQIQSLVNTKSNMISLDDYFKVEELDNQITNLRKQRQAWLKEIKRLDGEKDELAKKMKNLKSKKLVKLAVVGQILEYVDLINKTAHLITYGYQSINDLIKWNKFVNSILPCPDDNEKALALKSLSEENRGEVMGKYATAFGISLITNGVSYFMTFNPAAKEFKRVFKFVISLIMDYVDNVADINYKTGKTISKNYITKRKAEKKTLRCNKDDEDFGDDEDEDEDEDDAPPYPQIPPIHDPSGYVYEGVFSNRLEGVTATCYHKEEVEDMYGDKHENIVKWDAAEYAQENPLFTDQNGYYRWDVPQGLWQVKFEKEGYETTYSEWLPVPPPQLDINIAMKQNVQPMVKSARAFEDAVEIEFNKYMMPAYLTTDNINVSQNGKYIDGKIVLVDEEIAYNDENVKYASSVRFVPNAAFSAGKEVTLVVANRVKSYAGVQMADDFIQSFDIEKEVKSIVADSLVKVPYQGRKVVTLYVLPADAVVGKTMRAESSSDMIASLVQNDVIIDEYGMAQFEINGELPGTTGITFNTDGVKATATVIANVGDFEISLVREPKASLASGSSVYRGTTVKLSVDGKDHKIWYTTDGTCPCDENSRKLYTEPIVINSDMTLKAIAENADGDASDVATFIYSILQSKTGVALNDGWNWVSFNMKNDALSSVNTAMASGTWTSDDVIKDNKYVDMYSANQKQWIGTLSKHGSLNNTQMYKVHSSKMQTLGLTGEAAHPTETTITLGSGWNYISYLPLVNMSISDALKDYKAENGDVIKSQDEFATYSTANGWEGDLTTLTVGHGYMLKRGSNASQTSLTYPIEYSGTYVKAAEPAKSYRYAENMNIIGEVEGFSVENGDSLMAYVNGEMRGASRLERNKKVFLTVHGDEEAKMAIVLVRDGEIVATASNMIEYQSNNILGTSDSPTSIMFDTDDKSSDGCIENIKAIYNLNGIKMSTKHLNNISVGTYIIYSEKNGKTCVTKYSKR